MRSKLGTRSIQISRFGSSKFFEGLGTKYIISIFPKQLPSSIILSNWFHRLLNCVQPSSIRYEFNLLLHLSASNFKFNLSFFFSLLLSFLFLNKGFHGFIFMIKVNNIASKKGDSIYELLRIKINVNAA